MVDFPSDSLVVIRFAKEAQPIYWADLPADIIVRLAAHGMKQLVNDRMAGAGFGTGDDAGYLVKDNKRLRVGGVDMHDGAEVFSAFVSRLARGEWEERRPGPGTQASRLPWPSRWLYGLCEEKAPAFILAGKLSRDGKVDRAATKKNLAEMREALFTGEAFARWREAMLAKCPPEPVEPALSDEDLEALGA